MRKQLLPILMLIAALAGTAADALAMGRSNSRSNADAARGSAAAELAQLAEPIDENEYLIGPGNMVQIKIYGEAGVNQVYRVDESGFIAHALAGRVKIGGLTVAEAEEVMKMKLTGDYLINPQLNVFILEHSRYSVLGEVAKPGAYEITGRMSVIQALSIAGGFTPIANQKNVKILRKGEFGEQEILVDATRITQRGDRSGDIYIEADDVIVVPKSFF